MASSMLSYAGWTFLPGLVSGWVQTIYYGITIRAGDPKPQLGTPKYALHRRRIQTAVIILYLMYTIYEADLLLRQDGNFFSLLGVPFDADEKKIKSRLRRLAAQYHPDKITIDPANLADTETYFINLKQAQDTLSDPVRRFAYERFGPASLTWQHVSGFREYITHGLMVTQFSIYASTLLFLFLMSFTSYFQTAKFWRFLIVAALIILEVHAVTRPYFSPLLTQCINPILELCRHPPLLPFQMLLLARKISVTFFIAISQLSNLSPQKPGSAKSTSSSSPQELQHLTQLEQTAKMSDLEASRLLTMELAPLMADEQGAAQLKTRMREWLVNNTIRSDPEVRTAMGRAIERRRANAPPGAR